MDPAFTGIYREQLEAYRSLNAAGYVAPATLEELYWLRRGRLAPRRGGPYDAMIAVSDAIQSVARTQPQNRLRADAQLFLMTNLHQMVALPIAHPGSPLEFSPEIAAGLVSDCNQIVANASGSVDSERQLSAGDILRATARSLEQLTLSSWRLWDRNG